MSHTLAKKLAQVKPGTLFVGVDLGLDRNVAVIINGSAQRLGKFWFPHDQSGYAYFHRRLEKLQKRHQAPVMLVGMEPTNYFWKLLAAELEPRQRPYRLVNPFTVKKRREGDQLDPSKDDVPPPYAFRLSTQDDILALARLYEEASQDLSIHTVRSEEEWRYLLGPSTRTEMGAETWLVVDESGKAVGYTRVSKPGFGEGLVVSEVSRMDARMALAALRFLKTLSVEREKPCNQPNSIQKYLVYRC